MINLNELVYVNKELLNEEHDVIGMVTDINIEENFIKILLDIEYTKDSSDDLIRYIPYDSSEWKKI